MSSTMAVVTKEDLNYAAQKQKAMFARKTDVPEDYIVSGSQTSESNADGGENVFTFTMKNGSTSSFRVKNGSRGAVGAQGPKGDTGLTGAQGPKGDTGLTGAQGPQGDTGLTGAQGPKGDTGQRGATGAAGTRGSQIYWGTAITGTSATAAVFGSSGIASALVNDLYINTSTWNIYQCTLSGAASTAKWVYKGNIKGATGASGAAASIGTASVAGLTKLYTSTGTSTDGTMTRKAITDELGKYMKTADITEITQAEIDAMYASV